LKKIFESYDEDGSDYDTVHKGWPNDVQNLPYFYSQMAMYPKLAANVWRALSCFVVEKVEVKVVHGTNLKTPGIADVNVKVIYGGNEFVVHNVLKNIASPDVNQLEYDPNVEKITFECWDATGDKFLGEAELELWEILDEGLLHSKHLTLSPSQSKDHKKQTHDGLGGEIHIAIRKISHREETKEETKPETKQDTMTDKVKTKHSKVSKLSPVPISQTTETKEKTWKAPTGRKSGEKSPAARKSTEDLGDTKKEEKKSKEEKKTPRKSKGEAIMGRIRSLTPRSGEKEDKSPRSGGKDDKSPRSGDKEDK